MNGFRNSGCDGYQWMRPASFGNVIGCVVVEVVRNLICLVTLDASCSYLCKSRAGVKNDDAIRSMMRLCTRRAQCSTNSHCTLSPWTMRCVSGCVNRAVFLNVHFRTRDLCTHCNSVLHLVPVATQWTRVTCVLEDT